MTSKEYHCADRESNPGQMLGRHLCYHYTIGANNYLHSNYQFIPDILTFPYKKQLLAGHWEPYLAILTPTSIICPTHNPMYGHMLRFLPCCYCLIFKKLWAQLSQMITWHKNSITAPTGNRTQGKCLEGIYVTTTPSARTTPNIPNLNLSLTFSSPNSLTFCASRESNPGPNDGNVGFYH